MRREFSHCIDGADGKWNEQVEIQEDIRHEYWLNVLAETEGTAYHTSERIWKLAQLNAVHTCN